MSVQCSVFPFNVPYVSPVVSMPPHCPRCMSTYILFLCPQCVQLLMRHGCRPEAIDNDGVTSERLADLCGHRECAEITRRRQSEPHGRSSLRNTCLNNLHLTSPFHLYVLTTSIALNNALICHFSIISPTALHVIEAYHNNDDTPRSAASTDDKNILVPEQQSPSPVVLIPPLRPVTGQSTVVSRQSPPHDADHPVLVTNTTPIHGPGYPPNGCVPVTRTQESHSESLLAIVGRMTRGCQSTKPTQPVDRWSSVSRQLVEATSSESKSRGDGVTGMSPLPDEHR